MKTFSSVFTKCLTVTSKRKVTEKEKIDAKYLENKQGELIGLGQKDNREIESPRQRGFKYCNGASRIGGPFHLCN